MLTAIRRFFWKTDEEIALEESRPPKKDKWDYAIEQRQRNYEWKQIRIRYLQMEVIPTLEENIERDKVFLQNCIGQGLKGPDDDLFILDWGYHIAKKENELKAKKQELWLLKNPLGNRKWLNRI